MAKVVLSLGLAEYQGIINYIPHLAVSNPRSASTPIRICFDASRSQGGGPTLNKMLAKGPDSFLNNLAGVILRFVVEFMPQKVTSAKYTTVLH